MSVLNKGLSFIPFPKHVDNNDIMDGMDKLNSSKKKKPSGFGDYQSFGMNFYPKIHHQKA